jgi:hypothetical protein
MNRQLYIDSFSALLPNGIYSPQGIIGWSIGQNGPQDVSREQVLNKPYPNFGKLSLPDKLAFGAASLILSQAPVLKKETAAITLGICAGSFSTDLRYMESVLAGFPSPAIFSATLPSSAITDVAIYFGLKGPNRVCAGNAASGLGAFELAVMLLENGKADTALALSVTAVEPQDYGSPLLDPSIDRQNRAFAFLITTHPEKGRLGFRLNASLSNADKLAPPCCGELYFTELVELLSAQKNGSVSAVACDVTVEIQITT